MDDTRINYIGSPRFRDRPIWWSIFRAPHRTFLRFGIDFGRQRPLFSNCWISGSIFKHQVGHFKHPSASSASTCCSCFIAFSLGQMLGGGLSNPSTSGVATLDQKFGRALSSYGYLLEDSGWWKKMGQPRCFLRMIALRWLEWCLVAVIAV